LVSIQPRLGRETRIDCDARRRWVSEPWRLHTMLASDHTGAPEQQHSAGRELQDVGDTHRLTIRALRPYRCNFLWAFVDRAGNAGAPFAFAEFEKG